MWSLAPGARLKATPPSNSFELSLEDGAYLLLAGGIGVTPMVGMASALVASRGGRADDLCRPARADMAYLDELAGLP
jgi:ferredoxin-NADP reductase